METNCAITIYQVTKDWKFDKSLDAGTTYNAWVDPTSQIKPVSGVLSEVGKGMFFLDKDIDLSSHKVLIDDKLFDIVSVDRYSDSSKTFHHLEAIYK